MDFAEPLPDSCPPSDAVDVAYEEIYRLIPARPPTQDHFLSHEALGLPGAANDPCKRRACSLVLDPLKWVERLPRLLEQYPYAAKLAIPQGSGMSKSAKDSIHVSFWSYAHFSPAEVVIDVIELPGA